MRLFYTVLLCCGLSACGGETPEVTPLTGAGEGLQTSAARVRATAPGVRITAAYLKIENYTETEAILRAVRGTTPGVAAVVELHDTVVEDGVMKMRMAESFTIPAKSALALRPGAKHLMLLELRPGLSAGETLDLELQFASGATQTATAEVFE